MVGDEDLQRDQAWISCLPRPSP